MTADRGLGDLIEYNAFASNDCHSWSWCLPDGCPDAWSLANGNAKSSNGAFIPLSRAADADNDWFGPAYGTVRVSCKDGDDNVHTFESTDILPNLKVSVFFNPGVTDDGGLDFSAEKPPCWFKFWRQGVVPGLEDFGYSTAASYGLTQRIEDVSGVRYELYVGSSASGVHYPGGLVVSGVNYGGATGIDCCAEVVAHEKFHVTLFQEVLDQGVADTDPPNAAFAVVGDWLADNREVPLGCNVLLKDTFSVAVIRAYPPYGRYGDNEFACMNQARGRSGIAVGDWSKGGKQW